MPMLPQKFRTREAMKALKALNTIAQGRARRPGIRPTKKTPSPLQRAAEKPSPYSASNLQSAIRNPRSLLVERTFYSSPASIQDVRVNHRGADILVTEQLLNSPYVIPVFQ